MRAKVKYHVICRHKMEYPLSVMCGFFAVSRSGYYDYVRRLIQVKDAALAGMLAKQSEQSHRTYGYRRMRLLMKKYDLLSEIRRHRK